MQYVIQLASSKLAIQSNQLQYAFAPLWRVDCLNRYCQPMVFAAISLRNIRFGLSDSHYLKFLGIFECHDWFVAGGVQNIPVDQHFVHVFENFPIAGSVREFTTITFAHFLTQSLCKHTQNALSLCLQSPRNARNEFFIGDFREMFSTVVERRSAMSTAFSQLVRYTFVKWHTTRLTHSVIQLTPDGD